MPLPPHQTNRPPAQSMRRGCWQGKATAGRERSRAGPNTALEAGVRAVYDTIAVLTNRETGESALERPSEPCNAGSRALEAASAGSVSHTFPGVALIRRATTAAALGRPVVAPRGRVAAAAGGGSGIAPRRLRWRPRRRAKAHAQPARRLQCVAGPGTTNQADLLQLLTIRAPTTCERALPAACTVLAEEQQPYWAGRKESLHQKAWRVLQPSVYIAINIKSCYCRLAAAGAP